MPKNPTGRKKFTREHGTQDKAARALRVTQVTINRWLNGHRTPRGKLAKKLERMGITI